MRNGADKAVDRKYVHKKYPENVFLRGLRRSIPYCIEKETVENIIIPSLTLPDLAIFLEYYIFHKPGAPLPVNEESQDTSDPIIHNRECYILFNIPHTIEADFLENDLKLSKKDHDFLMNYYRKNEKYNCYLLKKSLSEFEDRAIQDILSKKDISLTNHEKMILYEIFESIEAFKKENVFYAEMLVDMRHSFFFEHHQEHVPGMMVMEAARQMTIACCHVFGNIPLKGSQIALNTFNAKFIDYIDLHYPIGMKADFLRIDDKNGEWTWAKALVSIFQKGVVCTEFDIDGRIMSKKLFSRFREGRNMTNPAHRFYPVDPELCPTSLWSSDKEDYYVGKLIDISLNGFCIEIGEFVGEEASQKDYDFIMYFPVIGFVRGGCHQRWSRNENESFFGGFHINRIVKADKDNLKQAVKRFCHLRTDRKKG